MAGDVMPLFNMEGTFYSDISMADMLYARVVRCPTAPGTLEVVSAPELPEGYLLFTAEDIPGANKVSMGNVTTGILASLRISYPGEPVGILVGPDIQEVDRILGTLGVTMLPEPTVPEPLLLAERKVCAGDPEGICQEADFTVEGTYSVMLKPAVCAEYTGCLAFYDGAGLSLYTPSSWTSHLKKTVAAVLNIHESAVDVQKTLLSEQNSNTVLQTTIAAVQAAVASFLTGRPVRLEYTKEEHRAYVQNGLPVQITHKTAVNADGMLEAMIIEISAQGGAYNPFGAEILDRLTIAAAGIYCPKSLKIDARMYQTAMPPAGVYFPWVDYNAFFAVENQMQKIAHSTGMTPLELRNKNWPEKAFSQNSFPFTFHLDTGGQVLQTLAASSDFNRRYTAYGLNVKRREQESHRSFEESVRGIGLAAAFEGGAYLGSGIGLGDQKIEVTMGKSGSVVIRAHQIAPAVRDIWLRIASAALDVPPDVIQITSDVTKGKTSKIPEQSFDNMGIMTHLLRRCCEGIQTQRFRNPLPITVARSITNTQKKDWNQEKFTGAPFFSTAFAAAVVEIEVDQYTFRDSIRNIWITVDCGAAVSTDEAEKLIKKAALNVLAGLERNDGLSNLHISFVKNEDEAKQVGNLIQRILPAAYTNALTQVVSGTVSSLPVQGDVLFAEMVNKSYRQAMARQAHVDMLFAEMVKEVMDKEAKL